MSNELVCLMDDSEKHHRRNLIAISVSIIAGWWFELKAPPSLQLIADLHLADIPGAKVWIAVLCVQIYILLRYHFSEKRSKQFEELKEAHQSRLRRYALAPLARTLASRRNQRARAKGEKWRVRPSSLELDVWSVSRFRWVSYREIEPDNMPPVEERYPYPDMCDADPLPRPTAALIQLRAWVGSIVLSRAALELNFPYFLAIAAILLSANHAGIPTAISTLYAKMIP